MNNQEKIKQALQQIDDGLQAISTDESWLKFLSFQALFYNYSFNNAMLIYCQNPEATYVMGYKQWNKIGRYVRKGEKGLVILAPIIKKVEVFKEPINKFEYHQEEGEKEIKKVIAGFRTCSVFDLSQTEGSDEALPILVTGLAGNDEDIIEIYERLKAFISTKTEVIEVSGTASKGSYNIETGVISIRSDLDALHKCHTILHEFAHSEDFRLHPESDISRNRRELVAESVSFIVALRLGLDTSSYSMGYIKSWLRDTEELHIIADEVQKVAAHIINSLAGSKDPAFSILKEEEA